MNRAPPNVMLVLYVMIGILLIHIFSMAIDLVAFWDNQWTDGHLGFTPAEEARYAIQAVESHILGTGMGLAVLMGLIGKWLRENIRGDRP